MLHLPSLGPFRAARRPKPGLAVEDGPPPLLLGPASVVQLWSVQPRPEFPTCVGALHLRLEGRVCVPLHLRLSPPSPGTDLNLNSQCN